MVNLKKNLKHLRLLTWYEKFMLRIYLNILESVPSGSLIELMVKLHIGEVISAAIMRGAREAEMLRNALTDVYSGGHG